VGADFQVKRSELKRKTPLPRGTSQMKQRKPIAKRSKSNSRPHENLPLREQYRRDHPRCLLCNQPADEIHHIRRGCLRVDVLVNLAALCWEHHQETHSPKSVYDVMTIRIVHAKWLLGEFEVAAWDAIGTPLFAGWLSRNEPCPSWSPRVVLMRGELVGVLERGR
jgi:hypothetical protein